MAEPEPISIFDLEADEALEARLDAEAEADIVAGRVVPHEKVAAWLDELAEGKRSAPPTA
jgi:predicted transcriptional regulator